MSDVRAVQLTRTNERSAKGTFGFSVVGGAGTALPVVVWEVSPGLPADLSKEVWAPLLYSNNVSICMVAIKCISSCKL